MIEKNSRFKIIGEASDGKEALEQLANLKPQIVILDIDMPRLNGLKTIRAMRELPFQVKLIVLTMYQEEEIFNAAMDLGTKAYVLKENAAMDVIAALEKVKRDETFLSTSMLTAGKRRGDRVRDLLSSKPQIESLTQAEPTPGRPVEVERHRQLLAETRDALVLTSKEIADRLKLSFKTVENHRYHICQKLNLRGTHSLLRFAFDNRAYL